MIALVFSYDVHDVEQFEDVYGPEGEWARFFRGGCGYIGTELLLAGFLIGNLVGPRPRAHQTFSNVPSRSSES